MSADAWKAEIDRELSEYEAGVSAYRDWMNEWRAKRGLPPVPNAAPPALIDPKPIGFRCKAPAE